MSALSATGAPGRQPVWEVVRRVDREPVRGDVPECLIPGGRQVGGSGLLRSGPSRVGPRSIAGAGTRHGGCGPYGLLNGRTNPSENGAASLLAVIWASLLGVVLACALTILGVWHAHARAAAAADLGALAGADRLLEDPTGACAAADVVTRANGARLVGCTTEGLDIVVTAAVRIPPGFARLLLDGRELDLQVSAHATLALD